MTDPIDETLEAHRRALLGARYQAPAATFDDHVRDALETERAVRRAERKPAQPSMAEFAQQEREKLRPKLQRTGIILDHAAQYGYGSEQRRR